MDTFLAKKIGSRQALKGVVAGLIIAYLIMTWFSQGFGLKYALLWFKNIDYKFNIFVGVIAILLAGHFLGQRAGISILVKNKNRIWIGILYGFLILLVGTIVASFVGVFQNIGIDNSLFFNYMVKPLVWVTSFGLIPVVIAGIWFGNSIVRQARRG
jgi:membrane protease YdiL (CAAX protease family)